VTAASGCGRPAFGPDGETVTSRYTLRELLDRLDELTGRENQDQPGDPG